MGIVIPVVEPTGARSKITYSVADRQASQLGQTGNEPLSEKEIDAVRWSVKRGCPFGNET